MKSGFKLTIQFFYGVYVPNPGVPLTLLCAPKFSRFQILRISDLAYSDFGKNVLGNN
jgi:hypothetical protein